MHFRHFHYFEYYEFKTKIDNTVKYFYMVNPIEFYTGKCHLKTPAIEKSRPFARKGRRRKQVKTSGSPAVTLRFRES